MKKLYGTRIILFVFILLFSCISFVSCNAPQNEQDEKITPCEIDVLKVGKADCIVINTGAKIVMIDTAEWENVSYIKSYMNGKGYEKIDTLILTHYDKDHIGGATEIISQYDVKTVIESKREETTVAYENYHIVIENMGVELLKLENDYSFKTDSCEFDVNVPKKSKYKKDTGNNSSLIISLTCGKNRLLFAGDALEERIDEFLSENRTKYDIIKLPHHGSYISNYNEFLSSAKPKYAVITDSNKNPASDKTLLLLSEKEIEAYETRNGGVNIIANGKDIKITQKNATKIVAFFYNLINHSPRFLILFHSFRGGGRQRPNIFSIRLFQGFFQRESREEKRAANGLRYRRCFLSR